MKKFLVILISLLFLGAAIFAVLGTLFTDKLLSEKLDEVKVISEEKRDKNILNETKETKLHHLYRKNNMTRSDLFPDFVRIKSEGTFRTNSEGDWKNFNEESYYSLNDPAFLSNSKLETGRFFWIRDIDLFIKGEGTQLRKYLSSLNLREETGPKIARLFLMRYLSDIVYFPSQLFNGDLITWKTASKGKIAAEIKFNDLTVEGEFTYNDLGEIETFKSSVDESESEENRTYLFIEFSDYKSFDGYYIPLKSISSWITPHLEYEFKISKIQKLDYDLPELFTEEEQKF